MKVSILGGGIASLLSAYEITKREGSSTEIVVYEMADMDNRGGLLKTRMVRGRKIDVGGPHIMFSSNEKILNKMLEFVPNAKEYKRVAKIAFGKYLLDYPIENGIWKLPRSERERYVNEMLTPNSSIPETMSDFFESTFGKSLTNSYFAPYNEKIWKRNIDNMETTWTKNSGRLPTPDPEKLRLALEGVPQEGYEIQSNFWYPPNGIQELYDNILEKCLNNGVDVKFQSPISSLKLNGGFDLYHPTASSGLVFSSIPLDKMNQWLKLVDFEFSNNPVTTVVMSLKKINYEILDGTVEDSQVLYVPDKDIAFHRLIFVDKFQEKLQYSDETAVMVELTGKQYYYMTYTDIANLVVRGLKELGLLKNVSDVIKYKITKNYYGYPVDMLGTSDARHQAISFLQAKLVFSIGRWGRWSYWNMDKVYMDVLDQVEKLFGR